jgi:tetratricopeptide (TPR) repeat protein
MSDEAPAYDLAAIRELLAAAFTPAELRRFCLDRPLFQHIANRFEPGYGLDDMVDEVLAYSLRWDLLAELLSEIAECNPQQFTKQYAGIFEDRAPHVTSAGELFASARMFLEKEAYEDAIRLLRGALEADPDSKGARRLLLEALYREGVHLYTRHDDVRGARQVLREVLAVDPSHEEAAQLLREIEQRLGDPPSAARPASGRAVLRWAWLWVAVAVLVAVGLGWWFIFGIGGDGEQGRPAATATVGPTATQLALAATPEPVAPTQTAIPASPLPAVTTAPSPTRTPTDTPKPTDTRSPTPTTRPTATSTVTPSPTATATPSPTASDTPRPPATATKRSVASPTRSDFANWYWRGRGPFPAENGAMAFVNYTDEALIVRLFDYHTGVTRELEVPAPPGSTVTVDLAPEKYAVHARTPTTAGMYVALLPTSDGGQHWHCKILDSLRVYKGKVLALAFEIRRGTPGHPETRWLDLAGCPWLEEGVAP